MEKRAARSASAAARSPTLRAPRATSMRWRWDGSSALTWQALVVAGTCAAELHRWRHGYLRRTLVASIVQLALWV